MNDEIDDQDRVDRGPMDGQQGYELRYFARKHGLTTAQAIDLIRRHGPDRAQLNAAAVRLRRSLGCRPGPVPGTGPG